MTKLPALLIAIAPIAACATVPGEDEPERRMPAGECELSDAQRYIGQRATAEFGAQMLRETGARVLRWVPPNTAVTMDFSPNRLTVSYDDNYIIQHVSCG